MKNPKDKKERGWHWNYCFLCGKRYSKVIHWGGAKKLKHCGYCQSFPHYCFKCFSLSKMNKRINYMISNTTKSYIRKCSKCSKVFFSNKQEKFTDIDYEKVCDDCFENIFSVI